MDIILRKKEDLNIDPRAKELIDILSIGDKAKILGSQQYQSQLYAGDYDLFEYVNGNFPTNEKAAHSYATKIKNVIAKLLKEKDVYIGDIKSGEKNKEPIRWKPNDILNGSKDGVSLEEAIQMDAMTKLDIIAWINDKYVEMSIIYEFKNGNETLNKTQRDVIQSITEDIKELLSEGQYFKALKRKFSIAAIKRKKDSLIKLNKILNSDLGRLYLIVGDMKTLIFLYENKDKIPKDRVNHELEQIRVRMGFLSSLPEVNNQNTLKKIEKLETANSSTILNHLSDIVNHLTNILNKKTKSIAKF